MDDTRNNTALKGGTALRFKLGLPRPSTDLDFEGDDAINVRKAVKAVHKGGLSRPRIQKRRVQSRLELARPRYRADPRHATENRTRRHKNRLPAHGHLPGHATTEGTHE